MVDLENEGLMQIGAEQLWVVSVSDVQTLFEGTQATAGPPQTPAVQESTVPLLVPVQPLWSLQAVVSGLFPSAQVPVGSTQALTLH